jgi:xylulokinase
MDYLLGIDIGTSTAKAVLLEAETCSVVGSGAAEYPILQPRPGYAEQDPEGWWQAAQVAVGQALSQAIIDRRAIRSIGLCGQMHGPAFLGREGASIRPAIIWPDTRSTAQRDEIMSRATSEALARHAPGPLATGFMAATLRWMAENEPATLERTQAVCLPKDYVRLRLTGIVATDVSDASATWLLDIVSGAWSDLLIDLCGLERRYLPPILGSAEVVGPLLAGAAERLGLPPGIPVVAGCADQPAQLIGHGLLEPGPDLVNIATGGQVVHLLRSPRIDPHMRFHVFNHAVVGHWYALAATLSAGLSLRWLRDLLGLREQVDAYDSLSDLASRVPPGAEGLVFLPYLAGERSPHMNPDLTGVLVGLRLHHQRGHLARAIMEGVAFSLCECLELVSDLDEGGVAEVIASGGGANSALWRQIQADAYALPLKVSPGGDHACIGAALLAGAGCGVFSSIQEACAGLPVPVTSNLPDDGRSQFYRERMRLFRKLHDDLREDMLRLASLNVPVSVRTSRPSNASQ